MFVTLWQISQSITSLLCRCAPCCSLVVISQQFAAILVLVVGRRYYLRPISARRALSSYSCITRARVCDGNAMNVWWACDASFLGPPKISDFWGEQRTWSPADLVERYRLCDSSAECECKGTMRIMVFANFSRKKIKKKSVHFHTFTLSRFLNSENAKKKLIHIYKLLLSPLAPHFLYFKPTENRHFCGRK